MTWVLLALVPLGPAVMAAPFPDVNSVLPRGGMRGTEQPVTLRGKNLGDPRELHFFSPGVSVKSLEKSGDKGEEVKAVLVIAPDAVVGERICRLRTGAGFSDPLTFWVGPYPNVEEKEPNSFREQAQEVPVGCTIEGQITSEDVDFFRFTAKKGQRISAEVEAMRLAGSLFDPYLALLDTNRYELAVCDDSPLLRQDAAISVMAPYDGEYTLEMRDSTYGGDGRSWYRLHVGPHSRPLGVFPPGGKPGETLAVTLVGDPSGPISAQAALPAAPGLHAVSFGDAPPPAPSLLRVADLPWFNEQEPNNTQEEAKRPDPPAAPVAFHGTLETPGDADWFVFTAKKDQPLVVSVYGRRLRHPIDPKVDLHGPDGKRIGGDDDGAEGVDAQTTFTPGADGDYRVVVRDHLKSGGPAYVYRVEIAPPAASLGLTLPTFKKDTHLRETVAVPRGNRTAILMQTTRENTDVPLGFDAGPLPAGVTSIARTDAGDGFPVLFEASTNAPSAGVILPAKLVSTDAARPMQGAFRQALSLVLGNPNNTTYYGAQTEGLALAVAEEVPFRVHLDEPATPVAQGGTFELGVRVERFGEFKEPLRVRLVWTPPGIGAPNEITIPPDSNRGTMRMTASGAASPGKKPVVVIAAPPGDFDQTWVSSQIVDLEVTPPWIGGSIQMVSVECGQSVDVVCAIQCLRPFEGEATGVLSGLPAGCTASEVKFKHGESNLVFKVQCAADAPKGQHKSLFVDARIPCNGSMVQNSLAGGATLRVDPPAPPKTEPASPPPAAEVAAATPPAPKPLSRLEQLRQKRGPK